MAEFVRILHLDNQIVAQLMDSILKEREIPHTIVSYRETAHDGLFQAHKGWGHLEAPIDFKKQIEEIYQDVQKQS